MSEHLTDCEQVYRVCLGINVHSVFDHVKKRLVDDHY